MILYLGSSPGKHLSTLLLLMAITVRNQQKNIFTSFSQKSTGILFSFSMIFTGAEKWKLPGLPLKAIPLSGVRLIFFLLGLYFSVRNFIKSSIFSSDFNIHYLRLKPVYRTGIYKNCISFYDNWHTERTRP